VTLTSDLETLPPRRRRLWPWFAGILGPVVLAVAIFLLLFQWNWLRGPLAGAISARIHRPVSIEGDLNVKLGSWTPTVTLNGLVIGNPGWAAPKPFASLTRLTIQAKILPFIFGGKDILPLVEADQPRVALRRDATGRTNWDFPQGGGATPAIGRLIIRQGAVSYDDPQRRLTFSGVMSSNETVSARQGGFTLAGNGTLNGAPFKAQLVGGALVNVDPKQPYDFTATLDAAETHLQAVGAILRPFDFSRLSGTLSLRGDDLADLYHITGLALPNSPPYTLTAHFTRSGAIYALFDMAARLGQSDLEGSASVDNSKGRPFVRADLTSRLLRVADLTAIVGGAPKHAAAQLISASQKIEAARLKAENRILPDATLDASRIRGMDAKIAYRAVSVEAGKLAIRAVRLGVTLDHGLLTLNPLEVTLPQGKLAGTASVDVRGKTQINGVDLRLLGASVANLLPTPKGGPPLEGQVWARARLTGTGDSIRAAAASANGTVSLVMPGGKVRKTIADLLGLDLGRTALQLITKNKSDTPVLCAVAHFNAHVGVLTAGGIVFDSDLVKVTGGGDIDLRDETLNFRLQGKPKKISFAHLDAPITITGRLNAPKVGVDYIKAAPQAVIGVALGVFAAPLAAILPFIAPNLSKNANCAALEAGAPGTGAPAH
jgi:uncharacterized protein involved in outer membrane biogenesis